MLYFVSNRNSAYYQSETFGKVLTYMTRNPMRGKVEEVNSHLRMVLRSVTTIDEACSILTQITLQKQEISL
jgi:transcription-repair coupling factor (superfamily II helicase)